MRAQRTFAGPWSRRGAVSGHTVGMVRDAVLAPGALRSTEGDLVLSGTMTILLALALLLLL